ANVAVILTRYDRDEDTVVAGILHDVVEDCVRDGYTQETLQQRIGDKFGGSVLDTVLQVTHRKLDDEGVELSSQDRKTDYLERLSGAGEAARWVCAADKIHNAHSILSDLRRTVDSGAIWSRFSGARSGTVKWYRDVYERLKTVGFEAPIMEELRESVEALEKEP
ncbi:MAG: HD domain-containing protein, partial [Gemmatimonadales bacterium]